MAMGGWVDPISLIVLLAVIGGIYILLDYFLRVNHDPREPPLIPQKIPFVGHIIGLIRLKIKYYAKIRYFSPDSIIYFSFAYGMAERRD